MALMTDTYSSTVISHSMSHRTQPASAISWVMVSEQQQGVVKAVLEAAEEWLPTSLPFPEASLRLKFSGSRPRATPPTSLVRSFT